MNYIILHRLKLILFLGYSGFFGSIVAQNQSYQELSCHLLLQKASIKYHVVFNYDYEEIKDLKCLNELPSTFASFRELLAEYSGLKLESYSEKLWIVKKNFTHQLKFLDLNGNPLPGVSLKQLNSSSNRFGNFFLKVNQFPIKYEFTYGNYDTQILEITKSSPKYISLNPIQYQLDEVILNNLYIKGVFLDKDKYIKVKPKYTPLLAGQVQQDAFVTLLNLPQISTTSESVAELNIKGGVNDQNLVLWNGIRIFQNGHFFGLLSAFNDNLIENITVIDNATPSRYGNALSGTIKLDFDPKISSQSKYGIGLNALSGHGFIRQKLNQNTELSLAFQRSFTNVLQTPTFESYREKVYNNTEIELSENPSIDENIQRFDTFYYQDAQFQLKKKFNKKVRFYLHGIWFENDLKYIEKINGADDKKSTYNNINSAIGLQTHFEPDEANNISLIYNISTHSSEGNNNTFSGNLDTFQSNRVESYFLQLHWKNSRQYYKFSSGIDFEGTKVSNRFNNNVTDASLNLIQVGNIYSTFADVTFQKKKWRLYTGIRNVYYQKDKQWSIEPRFNISYTLNETMELSLRGERKSQNLKQIIDLDQNFLGIEKRRWLMSGQDDMELQNTYQIETLLKFDINKFGGYASVFFRQMDGLSSNDQQFLNQNQFNSFEDGSSQIRGALFHLFYKDKIFNSWLSYSYLNEEISTPNQSFKGNNNLNYHITWGNNFRYNRWNFSLSCIFHDGLSFTSINQTNSLITDEITGLNTINYNAPNTEKLPSYFRMDTSLQYEYKNKSDQLFRFSLGIINILNSHNILRRNYRLNRVDSNQVQKIETIGLGFTPNFGVMYIF